MVKLNQEAALYLLLGLEKPDVDVGHHDLSRVQVVLTCPDYAAVDRAGGDEEDEKGKLKGEGFNTKEPPDLELSLNAVLLALKETGIQLSDAVWAKCIREDLKGTKADVPKDALIALQVVDAEQPPQPLIKTRTPSKRTGTKEIDIKVTRLTKEEFALRKA